jgi:hypothetical protein
MAWKARLMAWCPPTQAAEIQVTNPWMLLKIAVRVEGVDDIDINTE